MIKIYDTFVVAYGRDDMDRLRALAVDQGIKLSYLASAQPLCWAQEFGGGYDASLTAWGLPQGLEATPCP